MKIGFVSGSPLNFSLTTPYHQPLGGSESAMCYLAEQLSLLDHQVTLCPNPSLHPIASQELNSLDFLVIQNSPALAPQLKPLLGKKIKLILWTQHAPNQPAVAPLADPNVVHTFDGFVFVSAWQQSEYLQAFALPASKCFILRNAIAPAFANLSPHQKSSPPTLAYTSTPFRGLDLLLQIFPHIRRKFPSVTLKVFSSMAVYQADESPFSHLYDLCRHTQGVEYLGSLAQPQLAQELSSVTLFTYPNTFAETSCISVMEGMAAGCQVVTSDLGALRETTAGFATLIQLDSHYVQNFVTAVIHALQNPFDPTQQITFVNDNYTWTKRALEWEQLLTKML